MHRLFCFPLDDSGRETRPSITASSNFIIAISKRAESLRSEPRPRARGRAARAVKIVAVARSQQLICHLSGWPPAGRKEQSDRLRFSGIALRRTVIAGGGETESARGGNGREAWSARWKKGKRARLKEKERSAIEREPGKLGCRWIGRAANRGYKWAKHRSVRMPRSRLQVARPPINMSAGNTTAWHTAPSCARSPRRQPGIPAAWPAPREERAPMAYHVVYPHRTSQFLFATSCFLLSSPPSRTLAHPLARSLTSSPLCSFLPLLPRSLSPCPFFFSLSLLFRTVSPSPPVPPRLVSMNLPSFAKRRASPPSPSSFSVAVSDSGSRDFIHLNIMEMSTRSRGRGIVSACLRRSTDRAVPREADRGREEETGEGLSPERSLDRREGRRPFPLPSASLSSLADEYILWEACGRAICRRIYHIP